MAKRFDYYWYLSFFVFFLALALYSLTNFMKLYCLYIGQALCDFDLPHYDHGFKYVALTIDDAPFSHHTTPKILEILREHDANATFFAIGAHMHNHPEITQNILERNSIGNHDFTDDNYSVRPIDAQKSSLRQTQNLIDDAHRQSFSRRGEQKPAAAPKKWFRPGSGKFSGWLAAFLSSAESDYVPTLGSVYAFDAQIKNEAFVKWVVATKASHGGIIILHDRPMTVRILPEILQSLERRKFKVVDLETMWRLKEDAEKAAGN